MTPVELRQWRETKGWTQAKAAEWYGCTDRAWQHYEYGTRPIPQPLINRITHPRS